MSDTRFILAIAGDGVERVSRTHRFDEGQRTRSRTTGLPSQSTV